MDEIKIVATLRPAPPPEADQVCQAARGWRTYRTPRQRRPVMLAAGAAALARAALTAVIISGPASPSHTTAQHRTTQIVTAAWSVQVNRDLTITITIISQLRDPAGLQRALRQEGIPAIVQYTPLVTEKVDGQEVTGPACQYRGLPSLPPAVAQSVMVSGSAPGPVAEPQSRPVSGTPAETTPLFAFTIRPWKMPERSVVFIQVSMSNSVSADSPPVPNAFGLSLLANDHLPRCVPFREWLRQPGQK